MPNTVTRNGWILDGGSSLPFEGSSINDVTHYKGEGVGPKRDDGTDGTVTRGEGVQISDKFACCPL